MPVLMADSRRSGGLAAAGALRQKCRNGIAALKIAGRMAAARVLGRVWQSGHPVRGLYRTWARCCRRHLTDDTAGRVTLVFKSPTTTGGCARCQGPARDVQHSANASHVHHNTAMVARRSAPLSAPCSKSSAGGIEVFRRAHARHQRPAAKPGAGRGRQNPRRRQVMNSPSFFRVLCDAGRTLRELTESRSGATQPRLSSTKPYAVQRCAQGAARQDRAGVRMIAQRLGVYVVTQTRSRARKRVGQ